ncbi:polysaccharide biosynthesis protein [bacterium]|nr:polysaccharide biosynthesis protein [bacterium]
MNIVNDLINRFYLKLNRNSKRWIFRSIDLLSFAASICLAFILRFDFFEALNWMPRYSYQICLLFPVKFVFFWIVGIYRPVLRYTGLEFLGTAFVASVGSVGILALSGILLVITPLPRSILILDALLTLILVVGIRLVIRWLVYKAVVQAEGESDRENIIVYGAGEAGSQLVQSLSGENSYKVVGFVDDNSQLHNQSIHGIKIHSPKKLPDLIKKHNVDSILLAIISAGKQRNREVVESIQHLGTKIKTIPGVGEIISGKVSINAIRKIDIIDLLGREEIEPDPVLLQKNIKGKIVLVTGAGGSIGSELCRQIIQQNPEKLILFELNEFALYNIDIELTEEYSGIDIIPCLGSVLNQEHFEKILSEYQVETIYHAAAYKHVPLIESNITEGIFNNVKGTLSCVDAAVRCSVETFVLISTDKAVRPTNVMGTTKRIAEMILQAHSNRDGIKTRFVMVRFGNVLDSAGSVVPRFRKQLAEGKNLTITHKEIKRYFMSIPEASRLVIQAGALGKGGDVFILDMGESVKIYDLALQMIELSGMKLGKDIDIEFTGLRPGEKLYEELLIHKENSTPTLHPKIFSAKEYFIPWEDLSQKIEKLLEKAKRSNKDEVLQELRIIVPEFNHNGHLN